MVKGQVEGFRCDRRRRGRPGDAKATGDSKHQLAQAACLHSGCHVDRLIKQCYSLAMENSSQPALKLHRSPLLPLFVEDKST